MYQPISRRQHAITDYLYAPLIALTPILFGFRDDRNPALLAFVVGAGVLVATAMTRTELGIVKVIPYRVHLIGDFLGGLFFLVAPWLFGFAADAPARTVFLAMGAINVLASLLSRPEEMADTTAILPSTT